MAIEWKTKLLERLNKSDLTLNSEDDRVLKEVALFAEKCDVSEEISRLRSHLGQIRETVSQKGSIGRKLEFLLQEVSRELNTFLFQINSSPVHLDRFGCTGRSGENARTINERGISQPVVDFFPLSGLSSFQPPRNLKTSRRKLLEKFPSPQC